MKKHHHWIPTFLLSVLAFIIVGFSLFSWTNQQAMDEVSRGYQSFDNIYYRDAGTSDGEVILLVHGTPSSSFMYRKLIDELVEKGYRVIAPDLLGYGYSQKPYTFEELSIENQAGRLLGLMKHLGIETRTHVMHDIGGLWTWELMKQEAGHIERLVILNTVGYQTGFNAPMIMSEIPVLGKLTAQAFVSKLVGEMAIKQLLSFNLYNDILIDDTLIDGYRRPLLDGAWRSYQQFITDFDTTFEKIEGYNEMFAKDDMPPAIIIRGLHDKTLDGLLQAPLFARDFSIEKKDVHLWEDASHFIAEEKAPEIAVLIDEFLNR